MKYSNHIEIDLPIDRVVEQFDNFDNMFKWIDGLEEAEHISGEKGAPGAQMRMKVVSGNRVTEMIETVIELDLPRIFSAKYETDGVINIQHNSFEPLSDNRTLWKSESEFIFTTVLMKLVGFFMRGAFPKQSQKNMQDFKTFVEGEG